MHKKIVTVDASDTVVGTAETIQEAIDKGLFRRIVRVFIFDGDGRILIQKRSKNVRHPLLFDQSVGGHVDEGETYAEAATRETAEELGLKQIKLACFKDAQKEHNVFVALFKGHITEHSEVQFDTDEVDSVYWMTTGEIDANVTSTPESFAAGFVNVWTKYRDKILES